MSVQHRRVGVTADLTIDVPRDARGDLEHGVAAALRRVDAVESVASVEVTGLAPRLNDLRVEATVTVAVTVERDEGETARAALAEGFGVAVRDLALDAPPPD